MQLFASRQGNQKMRLIDTPGQGASGINLASESNFPKSSAAFVFTMPYSQLGDREDITILEEILRADPRMYNNTLVSVNFLPLSSVTCMY